MVTKKSEIKADVPTPTKAILFGLFYGFPLFLVTLLVHFNPSQAPPPTPFSTSGSALTTALFLWLITALAGWAPVRRPNKPSFYALFFSSFIIMIGLVIALGLKLHRDYYTILFQLLFNHLILLTLRLPMLAGHRINRHFVRLYTGVVLTLTVLLALWVIIAGHDISVRSEPRWAETIFYNLYNGFIILILVIYIIRLKDGLFKQVKISASALIVDGYDISRIVGATNLLILHAMASAEEERITCQMIDSRAFPENGSGEQPGTRKWSCEECMRGNYKVTQCPRYKTIYNGILELKKTLETFEIGTILPPENRKQILREGWKLMFFDGPHIRIC